MAKRPTLLQHFRSFAYQNNITDFDKALEYFTVFGGTGWDVDVSKSVATLIEEKVLANYEALHESMTRYTHNNGLYHMMLSIIALGVNHENDVFKKAKVGRDKGEEAIDYLESKSLITFDLSVEKPLNEGGGKSDRILFDLPFMRFWFAMISPNYQNIIEGDYDEFAQKWHKIRENFSILLSNLLLRDLVKETLNAKFEDDPIVKIGSYYDKKVEIDILAKRKSGSMIAAACKYSKEPAKSNMMQTLIEKCAKAELEISDYVLFSKNGFIPEVEALKEKEVLLLSGKNLSSLLDNLSDKDLLTYTNKKY
ncbi:ATPase [Sulfurovum lithotrophicum]|nr:ATPase [Sulfurovum lithotrophicum]